MKRLLWALFVLGLATTACSSDDAAAGGDRCERNTAVGTITVVTGFDFAATPGILDPIVAKDQGYYDELCLDVALQPGFAPSNHALVASGSAQFSNAGSFGEVAAVNTSGEAGLVTVLHYGKTAIEAIVVPEDSAVQTIEDLKGTTIGIKGAMPYSLQTMLGRAGVNPDDYDELLLDTYDPVAGFDLGIDALPVYKSNEPVQLENAGFAFRMFDPLDDDTPSSFGLMVTSQEFLDANPEVVSDFVAATLKGMEYAIANPQEAVQIALDRIDAGDNTAYLSDQTEGPRWTIERELVLSTTPPGEGVGLLDSARLEAEINALTEVGVFEETPDWESMIAPDIAADLYDGDQLMWPEQ